MKNNTELNSRFVYDEIIQKFITQYSSNHKPININIRKITSKIEKDRRSLHNLHKYPAKLLYNIPYFLINNNIFSGIGNTVLDPFCGSGTVLLEANLGKRNAIGADINPLATLIAQVKTSHFHKSSLWKSYRSMEQKIIKPIEVECKNSNVNKFWYSERIINELDQIYNIISKRNANIYTLFYKLCFSTTIYKVSYADPRLYVPVKLKENKSNHLFAKQGNKKLRLLETIDVKTLFLDTVRENINKLCFTKNDSLKEYYSKILLSDARELKLPRQGKNPRKLPSNSIDLIITSPPYAGAQKYIRSSSLSLEWFDYNRSEIKSLNSASIGRESTSKNSVINPTGIKHADKVIQKIYNLNPQRAVIANAYINEMKDALIESARVLKKNKYFILIIGDNTICGFNFLNHVYLNEILIGIGLNLQLVLVDRIQSFGMMTKRNNTANIINKEWILVYKK
jgi:DNA modification methylase